MHAKNVFSFSFVNVSKKGTMSKHFRPSQLCMSLFLIEKKDCLSVHGLGFQLSSLSVEEVQVPRVKREPRLFANVKKIKKQFCRENVIK